MIALQHQSLAQDMPPGEVARRNCFGFMWGILGMAERRRNRNRSADDALHSGDFSQSEFERGQA